MSKNTIESLLEIADILDQKQEYRLSDRVDNMIRIAQTDMAGGQKWWMGDKAEFNPANGVLAPLLGINSRPGANFADLNDMYANFPMKAPKLTGNRAIDTLRTNEFYQKQAPYLMYDAMKNKAINNQMLYQQYGPELAQLTLNYQNWQRWKMLESMEPDGKSYNPNQQYPDIGQQPNQYPQQYPNMPIK